MFQMWPGGNWSVPDVEAGESRSGHPCDAETALSAAHAAARAQPITTEFQSWVAWQLSLLQSGCDGLFSTIQVDKSSGLFSRLPVFWATKHYKTASEHFTAVSLESLRHICFTYPGQLILGSCCCSPKSGLAMLGGQIWGVTWDLIPPTLGMPKLAKTPKWQQCKNSSLQSHIWEFMEKRPDMSNIKTGLVATGVSRWRSCAIGHNTLGYTLERWATEGRRDSHNIDQGSHLLTIDINRLFAFICFFCISNCLERVMNDLVCWTSPGQFIESIWFDRPIFDGHQEGVRSFWFWMFQYCHSFFVADTDFIKTTCVIGNFQLWRTAGMKH